jgi:hypothetical protein
MYLDDERIIEKEKQGGLSPPAPPAAEQIAEELEVEPSETVTSEATKGWIYIPVY